MDETEQIRRQRVAEINSQASNDKDAERARLQAQYGQVYNTDELGELFEVLGFMAPFVVVRDRKTGKKGSLEFQHQPRFYFNYKED